MTRIILDTDIGTDVDDCLALALILYNSLEFSIEAITCVYGDVDLRARIALKLLQLRMVSLMSLFMRVRANHLMNLKPIYWEGHEGDRHT